MRPLDLLRFAGAVLLGLLCITALVEPLEFGLVTLVNGGVETDPEIYFGIRNRPPLLAAKLVYNTLGGAVGGYLAVRLAGRPDRWAGWGLAGVQGATLVWAMFDPALGRHTSTVAWVLIFVATVAGVVGGAEAAARRRAESASPGPAVP